MKISFLIAATVGAAAITATYPAKAEPFSGPFVGAEAGFESYPQDLSGGVATVIAGWDWRLGDKWVVGLEGRYGEPGAEHKKTATIGAANAVTSVALNQQVGGAVRVGRMIGDRTMVYASLGAETFDVKAVRTVTPRPPCANCNPVRTDFSFSEDVVTAGVGAEWAFSDQWSVRAAYTYADGDAYERNAVSVGVRLHF
jgi:outer membrane immunogenic protein